MAVFPKSKPRCFGLPSSYHQGTKTCRGCPERTECESVSYDRLHGLKSSGFDAGDDVLARFQDRSLAGFRPHRQIEIHLTVKPPTRQVKAEKYENALTQEDITALQSVPYTVAEKVQRMMSSNQDRIARAALKEGRNPFPIDGSRHLHVACDALLQGGFTKRGLRQRFMDQLGWGENTAFSHVSLVVSMFLLFKFVKQENDNFVLHPSIGDSKCPPVSHGSW